MTRAAWRIRKENFTPAALQTCAGFSFPDSGTDDEDDEEEDTPKKKTKKKTAKDSSPSASSAKEKKSKSKGRALNKQSEGEICQAGDNILLSRQEIQMKSVPCLPPAVGL